MEQISQRRLKEIISYDPATGSFCWLVNTRNALAGSPAGLTVSVIKIAGITYTKARLAWLYTHGEFPSGVMLHLNGNASDNRIENLRPATMQEVQWNIPAYDRTMQNDPDLVSGVRGVHWEPDVKKWRVRIRAAGKRIDLGRFKEKAVAESAARHALASRATVGATP